MTAFAMKIGDLCTRLHSGRAQVGEGLAPEPQAAEIPYPVHGQVHEQVGLEVLLTA